MCFVMRVLQWPSTPWCSCTVMMIHNMLLQGCACRRCTGVMVAFLKQQQLQVFAEEPFVCSTDSRVVLVSGACTTLVHFTGQVMWDSIGSICVGAMMGVTAWFLISRNRQMLIGGP